MKEPEYKPIPGLDDCIHSLLDWLDGSAMGLGEVIDRLRHLSSCRAYSARYLDGVPAPSPRSRKRRFTFDPAEIKALRDDGNTFDIIASKLGCSVGTVSKILNQSSNTTRRQHIEICARRDKQ